jgi:hypothetical protein
MDAESGDALLTAALILFPACITIFDGKVLTVFEDAIDSNLFKPVIEPARSIFAEY